MTHNHPRLDHRLVLADGVAAVNEFVEQLVER